MVYELEDVLQESSLETVLENGKQAVILVTGRETHAANAPAVGFHDEIVLRFVLSCEVVEIGRAHV